MSRPTFLTTSSSSSFDANEAVITTTTAAVTNASLTTTNSSTDHSRVLHFHPRIMPTISSSSRSNETLPVLHVQSNSSSMNSNKNSNSNQVIEPVKSVAHLNPKMKRNLRGKRRSTGIRPDDVSLANAMNDNNNNEGDEDEEKGNVSNQFITISTSDTNEAFDPHRTSPPKPVFKVSRVQPTFDENSRHAFEKLSITRTDPFVISAPNTVTPSPNLFPLPTTKMFRQEEFILRRQPSDEDSSSMKRRSMEERVRALESTLYEKDSIILDLQRKLEQKTRDLTEAEQQIFILQRDKLTLIKTLTSLQDTKPSLNNPSGDMTPASPLRTGFLSRN